MKKVNLMMVFLAVGVMSCKENSGQAFDTQTEQESEHMAETDTTSNEDGSTLFNGEDLSGWKAYNSEEITQWKVEDGTLAFAPAEGERSGSENIISEDTYTNFELSLEWKISEGGNSGIMWGVQEDEKFNEPYLTGPEIQILDNERHPDAENGPIRQSGALYDLSEPTEDVTNPAGEWNEMTISINYDENRGTVSMNGTQVNEFPLHGEEWDKMVENSKFSDWEDFGKHRTGHIALQDHGDKVAFRNIEIKELD
ncbi:glycosyl hydrolase [Salinimicrobium marinum]|uniref:Glycosyl hydrolase n=1 Tax=Salinimicrobium marinum TaxID=680283 RepID=A0A918SHA0_9FLAO|nr:DUF1080 domain-containing protein [Salinimicrobium marinum]GHA42129.1 glycosyl hydrolase [Salinimicrobium marinum]